MDLNTDISLPDIDPACGQLLHQFPIVCVGRYAQFPLRNGRLQPKYSRSTRDAPDIRPDNPAFFDIWYPAGYQIALPDIR
jgi:hypothetical protein